MRGYVVVDVFGFAWGDLVDDIDEARRQLEQIRADMEKKGWDYEFHIERRGF